MLYANHISVKLGKKVHYENWIIVTVKVGRSFLGIIFRSLGYFIDCSLEGQMINI